MILDSEVNRIIFVVLWLAFTYAVWVVQARKERK